MGKSVIIVGGGIAGLAAAIELLARGWRATILEAKERLGGRIHTVRSGSIPVELGAEFVHGEDPALAQLIRDAGLETHDVPEQNRILRDGRLEKVPLWDCVGEIIHRVDPHNQDEPFAEFVKRSIKDPQEREVALGFVQGFNAADPARTSAHALLRAEVASERSSGSKQTRISRGYGALVEWMESKVRENGGVIQTGAVARRVKWKHGEVDVFFERGEQRERISASAALITLPLGVLKRNEVKFEPSLPHKVDAITDLQFGNVRRLTLIFREVWWPKHNFGFIHSFADAFPTWWSDPRGPVLTGWAGGPKADALARKSEDELKSIALEILARIFSERVGALDERLVSAHTYDWAADPYIRGAYTYIPVFGLDLPKLLAEPVDGTLFFAGEATVSDAQTGTVFAAVESAWRAVREMTEMR